MILAEILCVSGTMSSAMVTVVTRQMKVMKAETFCVGKLIQKFYCFFAFVQKNASRTTPENMFSIYSLVTTVTYNYKIRVLKIK